MAFSRLQKSIILGAVLLVSGCGTVAIETIKGTLEGIGKTEQQSTSSKSRGIAVQRDQNVLEAQTYLSQLGYDVGKPDGIMGPKTRDAIMLYRSDFGIPGDDNVDGELLNHLATSI